MRLDKFLSEMGISTRKETALAAKKGLIIVNGEPMKDASKHIDPETARVVYMGREISYSKYTYVMLNKPEGYVSATEDRNLPVVTELLSDELQRMELFPVGRLDRDTVGLMILTNNGKLAHRLLSPKRHVEKEYYFKCAEPLIAGAEERFKNNIVLADGYECKSAVLIPDEDRLGGKIILTEGKYHQIKRMIASLENKVVYLERIRFSDIMLDSSLSRGEWRYLTDEEKNIIESWG
ncbi:MAG: 16S rRNA pseudouridine(516) synthase [Clostridia bacterium]|nr:16S rRNA pseudouridine(516) synthase [Clostridia bacterium]